VLQTTRGAIAPDGLHLTERGARALGATLAAALGLAPGAGAAAAGPPTT
jgi:hypothetical protein